MYVGNAKSDTEVEMGKHDNTVVLSTRNYAECLHGKRRNLCWFRNIQIMVIREGNCSDEQGWTGICNFKVKCATG